MLEKRFWRLWVMTKKWEGWGAGAKETEVEVKERVQGLAKLTKGYGDVDLGVRFWLLFLLFFSILSLLIGFVYWGPQLLLFLDEPTSGLDSQSAWLSWFMAFLRSLADNGQSILCTWVPKLFYNARLLQLSFVYSIHQVTFDLNLMHRPWITPVLAFCRNFPGEYTLFLLVPLI